MFFFFLHKYFSNKNVNINEHENNIYSPIKKLKIIIIKPFY